MFKRVFLAVAVIASLACISAPAQARIVVSAVETITGGTTSKTVTININTVTVDPTLTILPPDGFDLAFERVGYYNFRVDLTGAGITDLTAAYNTTSVWNGLTPVPGGPVISGTQVTFKGGSTSNIAVPLTGNNFVGSVTFTTTLNGNYNFALTALNTNSGGGVTSQNAPGNGFVRNGALPGVFQELGQDLVPKVITVSGITAVPEPSSILLIGVAVAGLGGVRLRKRLLGKAQKA